MILLEYYKLELSLVMPKICLLVRKAQGKGKTKLMEKTKTVVEQTILKVRKGVVRERGPQYNVFSEAEFNRKLSQFVYVSKDIQRLNLEIETSIQRATTGGDPELLITIDDSKLNLEVYQQIMCKLYAVIRYKIYQKIKLKQNKNKSPNTSVLTKDNSIGADEDNSINES